MKKKNAVIDTRKPPTPREQETLSAIIDLREEHDGLPPSVREIADRIGVKSTYAARLFISKLIDKGYLARGDGARNIRVL